VGDLGAGVKAPGSSDAGPAGQAQAGQTSQGLFPRPRAEQPFGRGNDSHSGGPGLPPRPAGLCAGARRLRLLSVAGFPVSVCSRLAEFTAVDWPRERSSRSRTAMGGQNCLWLEPFQLAEYARGSFACKCSTQWTYQPLRCSAATSRMETTRTLGANSAIRLTIPISISRSEAFRQRPAPTPSAFVQCRLYYRRRDTWRPAPCPSYRRCAVAQTR
jgi:hypothetical protein